MIDGFRRVGVVPILKHAPGHGRARVDPHLALPTVDASRATLVADFAPFRELAAAPAAMVAHIVYTALDAARPATCSPDVVDLLRRELGLAGLLFSDDVDMGALAGEVGARVRAVLDAGLDVALQCNGVPADLEAALDAAPPLSTAARKRLDAARALGERSRTEAAALDAALDAALG
jgi:beta-N-acetylhexosaminidase